MNVMMTGRLVERLKGDIANLGSEVNNFFLKKLSSGLFTLMEVAKLTRQNDVNKHSGVIFYIT